MPRTSTRGSEKSGVAGSTTDVLQDLVRAGSARLVLRSHEGYELKHGDGAAFAFHPPFSGVGVADHLAERRRA